MGVGRKGRRAMAVGAAKSDMKRGMKARWSQHKGRRGEAVGMAERALIDKWHRGDERRSHGRMVHHHDRTHKGLTDRHHQSLGARVRESAGAAGKKGGRHGNMGY